MLVFQDSFVVNFSQASSIHPDDRVCYNLGGVCDWREDDSDYVPCTVKGQPGYIFPGVCRQHDSLRYRCCRPIDESKNTECTSKPGADCVFLPHTRPSGSCTVNGKPGTIYPGLCDGAVSNHYRCCVPDEEEEEEEEEEDRVYGDQACDYMVGQCQWVSGRPSGDMGECTVHGQPGCYVYGACRTEPHEFRSDQRYLCCTADEEFCGGGVSYDLWEDLYINGDCPFSKGSLDDDRLWCSQGPENDRSHKDQPAVDIQANRPTPPGTEYFIAPENGVITYAKAFTENGSQKCGCHLKFETESGLIYEIRHCYLFTGVSVHFNSGPRGDGSPREGEPIRITKGTVLARIAHDTDSEVINHIGGLGSCTTGPHFHVDVIGADRCVDCHFVDNFGCNLFNDGERSGEKLGECGRCWRDTGIPECFGNDRVADWGGVKCDDGCEGCNIDSRQYCCETDKEICPDTGKEVCKCPHQSPSDGSEDDSVIPPPWL